ncbi:MAG: hypothetical protein F6K00_35245 [Leptolyngbya sp. SIOISBB]|nr:hypothetical protein [Leptolyngbya sp. SIOISBB]
MTRSLSGTPRLQNLINQGIFCSQQVLYRATDGCRVFVITTIDHELEADEPRRVSSKPRTRRANPQKRRERTQQVDYR